MINVVGIGPGSPETITPEARTTLEGSDHILGYERYLNQLADMEITPAGDTRPYKLGEEKKRASDAIRESDSGREVSLVSSGDAGIYGIAAALFEQLDKTSSPGDIKIIPGVSAIQAAAARLGCPIAQDFATVSLSDLLTPWEKIESRLFHAGAGDFVVLLLNPRSNRRTEQLPKALDILRDHRPDDTPVGHVQNVYRSRESCEIHQLGSFEPETVDMNSIIVVGNRSSGVDNGWFITPRGYS